MSTELEKYHKAREALIQDDLALRRENSAPVPFSDDSAKADAVLRRIRQEEADAVWAKDYASIPHPFPGMEFLTGVF
jgi:adenosine deaminase CECR1